MGPVLDPSASPHAEAAKITVSLEDGEHRDVGDLVWTGGRPELPPDGRRRRRGP